MSSTVTASTFVAMTELLSKYPRVLPAGT